MGPSHYIAFRGFALTKFSSFDTPLGPVPVDTECKLLYCLLIVEYILILLLFQQV